MTSFPVKCKHITLSFPYKVKVKGQRWDLPQNSLQHIYSRLTTQIFQVVLEAKKSSYILFGFRSLLAIWLDKAGTTQTETSLLKQYVAGERVDLLDDYDLGVWQSLTFCQLNLLTCHSHSNFISWTGYSCICLDIVEVFSRDIPAITTLCCLLFSLSSLSQF